ncbi:MAG: hypothetical protein ACI95C_000406 [Pseudohongiellaceae bacterium]|jgi:hypothetical protein
MTLPDTIEQQQMLIMDYLYGEMSAAQRLDFETALTQNSAFNRLYEAELKFDASFPIGVAPAIDAERIEGNRWLLRQKLKQANRPGFSLKQLIADVMQRPLTAAFQGAAMALTFVLGVMVATPESGVNLSGEVVAANGNEQSPLALINDDDFEIYRLKVNNYDAMTGDIDLSFSLASETRLSGNVADASISQLMAVALLDDINSASRLDTINALQPVLAGDKVYTALIHVLTTDLNPGVRYQAVQSLVTLTHVEKVRDALRYALVEDVNPGVRIQAFEALLPYQDEQTLDVFRSQMNSDSNEYIRAQSRLIIEQLEDSSINL